jgi:hypothetical protein
LLSLTFNRLDVGEIRRKESIPRAPIGSYAGAIGAGASSARTRLALMNAATSQSSDNSLNVRIRLRSKPMIATASLTLVR